MVDLYDQFVSFDLPFFFPNQVTLNIRISLRFAAPNKDERCIRLN
jgi:hypothetical protein